MDKGITSILDISQDKWGDVDTVYKKEEVLTLMKGSLEATTDLIVKNKIVEINKLGVNFTTIRLPAEGFVNEILPLTYEAIQESEAYAVQNGLSIIDMKKCEIILKDYYGIYTKKPFIFNKIVYEKDVTDILKNSPKYQNPGVIILSYLRVLFHLLFIIH